MRPPERGKLFSHGRREAVRVRGRSLSRVLPPRACVAPETRRSDARLVAKVSLSRGSWARIHGTASHGQDYACTPAREQDRVGSGLRVASLRVCAQR